MLRSNWKRSRPRREFVRPKQTPALIVLPLADRCPRTPCVSVYSAGPEHFVLQLTWMLPHKSDPKRRKVDVDLSAILIRSDEYSRAALSDNAPFTSAYSSRQRDWWPIDYSRLRIGWSGWVNIIFVSVACLIGFFCAPFVFNSPEYSRLLRHGFEEVPYARVDLSEITSHQIASNRSSFDVPRSIQLKMNPPEQRTPQLDGNPGSFGHTGDFPSLQTGDRIADSGSSLLHSTGFASANASENTVSNGPDKSDEKQTVGKVTATRLRVFRRHAQTSSAPLPKRISSDRQNFLVRLFSGTRNATDGKSMAQSRQQSSSTLKLRAGNEQRSVQALQTGSSRTAMDHSMRPIQAGVAAMQNPANVNMMHMQNTMMSQSAFHGGGGLGNVGGGVGNLSAGARR